MLRITYLQPSFLNAVDCFALSTSVIHHFLALSSYLYKGNAMSSPHQLQRVRSNADEGTT